MVEAHVGGIRRVLLLNAGGADQLLWEGLALLAAVDGASDMRQELFHHSSQVQAMAAAKAELQERRRDVDGMRVKLDSVMERLSSGHQANLTLQTHILTGQDHAGARPCSHSSSYQPAPGRDEFTLLPDGGYRDRDLFT